MPARIVLCGVTFEVTEDAQVYRIEGWGKQKIGTYLYRGAPHVAVRGPDGGTTIRLARLVLSAFTGLRPPSKTIPVHADGNPLNCHRDNLTWGRRQYTKFEMPLLEKRPWIKNVAALCDTVHRLGGKSPRAEDIS